MKFLHKTGVARIILPLCALNLSVCSAARDCPPIDPKIDIGEVRAFWLEEINYSLYPEEFDKLAKRDACFLSDWVDLYSDGATRAKRKADARRAVEANRAAAKKRAADLERAASKRRAAWEAQGETIKADKRLAACDSFGFERGTNAHAECAMKLYINEQNQNRDATTVQNSGRQNSEQKALLARQRQQLARQEAIQEAILKEQERVRRMEQSMKLIELGTGIATGSLGGRPTPKMQSHTYTINGQIINCTTTGSSTDCR